MIVLSTTRRPGQGACLGVTGPIRLSPVTKTPALRLERDADGNWRLAGPGAGEFALVNDYLGYLADRNYSPRTARAYGFDLLAFCRWLIGERLGLEAVTTLVLLRFMRFCRAASVPGRHGGNVITLDGRRLDEYAATTINRRLAAISGLF